MHETFEVIKPDMNDVWGLGRTKEGRIGLFAHSLVSPVSPSLLSMHLMDLLLGLTGS